MMHRFATKSRWLLKLSKTKVHSHFASKISLNSPKVL